SRAWSSAITTITMPRRASTDSRRDPRELAPGEVMRRESSAGAHAALLAAARGHVPRPGLGSLRPPVVLMEQPRVPRLHRDRRAVDVDLLDGGRDLERIAVRHHQVRDLAGFDRAHLVPDAEDLRGPQRHALQSVLARQPER